MKYRVFSTFGIALSGFGILWLPEFGFGINPIFLVVFTTSCSAVSLYLAGSTIVKYRFRGLWTLLAVPFALYWPLWFYAWG